MSLIITGKIYCPLCELEMKKARVSIKGNPAHIYYCRPCNIGIYDFDPAFNRWRDTDKTIPCPNCSYEKMKWFARYMDGFFKGVCPKCHAEVKKDGDVRFQKDGSIVIPEEMEDDNIEEPTELKIPLGQVFKNLGKDKLNEIKNKLKRKKE